MSIHYPDNTLNRSALSASGITDASTYLDVVSGGSERRLSIEELKKTGVQVINVLQYGADPTGALRSDDKIQLAINAASGVGGGIIFIPAGDYKFSGSVAIPSYVHVVGAGPDSTTIQMDGTNFSAFTLSGSIWWSLRDMKIRTVSGQTANGTGIDFLSGNVSNFIVSRVQVLLCLCAVNVDSWITHGIFELCEFSYCTNDMFYFDSASIPSNLIFNETRFEQTYSSALKVHTSVAGHTLRFNNCVVEACHGQYAVDLGSNPYNVIFNATHFEANSLDAANGSDIRVVAGRGSVTCINCNFSTPWSTATNHYNIRGTSDPIVNLNLIGNVFASANSGNASQYTGVAYWRRTNMLTCIGNNYTYDAFNYYPQAETRATHIGERPFGTNAYTSGPVLKYLTTSGSTPTQIYSWDYTSLGGTMHSYLCTANIVAISDDAATYAAYKRSCLVVRNDTGNTTTLIGTLGDSQQESDAGLDAAWSVTADSEGTIKLTVTGKVATNIKWHAEININVVNY